MLSLKDFSLTYLYSIMYLKGQSFPIDDWENQVLYLIVTNFLKLYTYRQKIDHWLPRSESGKNAVKKEHKKAFEVDVSYWV